MKTVIITPSYAPDFERCKILCESVTNFATSYDQHIIIVDARDLALFQTLKAPKIRIITKESILPRWIKKIPFSKRWWFSFKTLPVRGWILQQIIKMSVAEHIDADMYLFIDSDIMLIRPVDMSFFMRNGKVRMYRFPRVKKDFTEKRHMAWYRYAGKLFGLKGEDYLQYDYIGPFVTWRKDTLIKMNRHIEKLTGKKHWQMEICNTLDFSEYILYGLFCEFILKEDSGHYFDDTMICHTSWIEPINNLDELEDFLKRITPEHIGICIQSNLKIEPDKYIDFIRKNILK